MLEKPKQTRVKNAYLHLKEEILANRMPPGFQGTEPEIAIRLGMSRTPVREALIRLESDGLVELIPRRGARILPIRAEDMREIYEILTALEPDAAAKLAEQKPSKEVLAPLEEATCTMEKAITDNDLERWAEADDRFHRTLLELNANQRLTGIVTTLFDQAHRARMFTLRLRELPVRSTEEHRLILKYIHEGKSAEARELFTEHRRRAAAELLGILDNYNLPQL